jgi:hypothetical protein
VSTAATPISGVVPVTPLGILWNRFTRTLFVADSVPSDGGARLRLLTIDPVTGVSSLLWETKPAATMPQAVMFSVDAAQEVAVGLVGVPESGRTELLLLDTQGKPLLSGDVDGSIIGPPHATPDALDLSFKAIDPHTLVRFDPFPRWTLGLGSCGAQWLHGHVQAPWYDPCGI